MNSKINPEEILEKYDFAYRTFINQDTSRVDYYWYRQKQVFENGFELLSGCVIYPKLDSANGNVTIISKRYRHNTKEETTHRTKKLETVLDKMTTMLAQLATEGSQNGN